MTGQPVRPGDPIRASAWNELLRNVRRISGKSGVVVKQSSNGAVTISPQIVDDTGYWFTGKIVAAGPAAEADFADERYWVRATTPIAGAPPTWENITASGHYYVVASNLCEMDASSHDLATDGSLQVVVFKQYNSSAAPLPTYCFGALPAIVSIDVITSIRYDSVSHKFQYKKTTIYVLGKDAEGAWTDIVALTECDDAAP